MKGEVQIYKNLHKTSKQGETVYSVRNDKNIVEDHSTEVTLIDPKFRVGKKGRERVPREKRKNVHAFVRGERVAVASFDGRSERITYNPYKYKSFVSIETGKPVFKKDIVSIDGRNILAQ